MDFYSVLYVFPHKYSYIPHCVIASCVWLTETLKEKKLYASKYFQHLLLHICISKYLIKVLHINGDKKTGKSDEPAFVVIVTLFWVF